MPKAVDTHPWKLEALPLLDDDGTPDESDDWEVLAAFETEQAAAQGRREALGLSYRNLRVREA